MDKRKLISSKEEQSTMKVDCSIIETYLLHSTKNHTRNTVFLDPTSEVHGDLIITDKLIQDVRTYICVHGKCKQHYKRSHRRISNYIWNKMQTNQSNLFNIATNLAEDIIKNTNTISSTHTTQKISKVKCDFCHYPKVKGIKHQHFLKASTVTNIEDTKTDFIPIEEVFSRIDDKALHNTSKILNNSCPNPPGKQIKHPNEHRMSYGDINYLGNNKALLYFDRGVSGKQTFTNSMQPISRQQKHNDIIVLDGIVFTSSCKCNSTTQHQEMFPHYRETCAAGLTCPKRLNNFEREIFKRSRNASTEMYTKANSMLIRYWK